MTRHWTTPFSCALSSLAVAAFAACASTAPSHASLPEAFAEIQIHEAGIERARAAVARSESTCSVRCDARASSAEHTRQLCELARRAADADALSRCDRAQETSGGIAANATATGCACTALAAQ